MDLSNQLRQLFFSVKLKRIRWIIWDFDGTLYSGAELGNHLKQAYYDLAHEHGAEVSLYQFDNMSHQLGSWSKAVAHLTPLTELDANQTVDRRIDKVKYIGKNPDMVRFVTERCKSMRHIIATNSTQKQTIEGLIKIGFPVSKTASVPSPFECIFSRDVTRLLKPSSQLLDMIVAFTKAPKHHHLMIGDSYIDDIKPARDYGFQALGTDELSFFRVFRR